MTKLSTASNRYSPTRLKTWFNCPREYRIKYIDGYEAILDSFEINYGKRFHNLVEGIEPEVSLGPKWGAIIAEHKYAYDKVYESSRLKVVDREVKFDNGVVRGYLDAVAVDDTGGKWIVETKTTGSDLSVTSSYWNYKEHDIQPSVYMYANPEYSGVIWDVTRRPSIRQKRSESDEQYIQRCADWFYDNRESAFVRKPMYIYENFEEDLFQNIANIESAELAGSFPRNPGACYKGRHQCGFYQACWSGAKLTDTNLYQIRKGRK